MKAGLGRARWPFLSLLAVCLLGFSSASATEGPFWKVSGRSGTAYLFGSIHFGVESIYPLDAAVENAFTGADRLVVEVNVPAVDSRALTLWMAQHGAYTDGSSLPDNVSPETWQLLRRRAENLGVPAGAFTFQRPWLAAFSMTSLALTREGFREDLGIDRYFLSRAAGKKPVLELETIQYQMGLLAGFSPQTEEYFLKMTLEDLAAPQSTFSKLFQAWKRGDAEFIASQTERMRTGRHGEILASRLIYERNENMTEKIDRLLSEGGTTFVVVGAAHLVGKRGLASLLRSRGYRVEKH